MFSTTMENMQEVIIEQKFNAKQTVFYIVDTVLVTIERDMIQVPTKGITVGDVFDIMERRPKAATEMLTDFLTLWEQGKLAVKEDFPFTCEEMQKALFGEEKKDEQK